VDARWERNWLGMMSAAVLDGAPLEWTMFSVSCGVAP